MAIPVLHTRRLVLRPLSLDDRADLTALHAQESFWHFPFRRPWSGAETDEFLERTLNAYTSLVPAMRAVVVASTNELAGWAGLAEPTFLPEILPAVEVGWRLGEEHRGRGYASEAGAAWIDYGFSELALDKIVSIYEPQNTASGAVMKRLGFRLDLATIHPEQNVEVHVMSLTRAQWTTPATTVQDHHSKTRHQSA